MNTIELKPITYRLCCTGCIKKLSLEEILYNQCKCECINVFRNQLEISFTIPLKPVGKESARKGKTGRFYNPQKKEMDEIKNLLKLSYKSYYFTKGIPLKYTAIYYLNQDITLKPDTDNCTKFYKDCMEKIVYHNDSQVTHEDCKKRYVNKKEDERIEIKITLDM